MALFPPDDWDINTELASRGYALNFSADASSPVDGQTLFVGFQPIVPVTTGGQRKMRIPRTGIIKHAYIYSRAGTAGSAEAWAAYVRLNNATDTLIQSVALNTAERIWENTGLSIPVTAGDYIEIKFINPTWGTNPGTWALGGFVYIDRTGLA